MGKLIRLDGSGQTTLAEWTSDDGEAGEAAVAEFRRQLDRGMIAAVADPDGSGQVVRELPLEADLVVLRRPIVGG